MELVVFIAVLVALGALADRFGADSRDTLQSHEAELAARGYIHEPRKQTYWDDWSR